MLFADWSNKKGWFVYNPETDETEFIDKDDWDDYKTNIESLTVETGCPESYLWGIYNAYIVNGNKVAHFRESKNIEKSDESDAKTLFLYCTECNDNGIKFKPKIEFELFLREKVNTLVQVRKAYNILENMSKALKQEFKAEADKNQQILEQLREGKKLLESDIDNLSIVQKYKVGLELYFKTDKLGISSITIAKMIDFIGNPAKYQVKGRKLAKALKKKFKTIPTKFFVNTECKKCIDGYPCKSCRNKYSRKMKREFYQIIKMGQKNDTLIGKLYRKYYEIYKNKYPEKIKVDTSINENGKLVTSLKTRYNKDHLNKMITSKIINKLLDAWVQIDVDWNIEAERIKAQKQVRFL